MIAAMCLVEMVKQCTTQQQCTTTCSGWVDAAKNALMGGPLRAPGFVFCARGWLCEGTPRGCSGNENPRTLPIERLWCKMLMVAKLLTLPNHVSLATDQHINV